MILNTYNESELYAAFGIEMSTVEGIGVGAGWGRVAPGTATVSHGHDETEFFVIVAGVGELTLDGRTHLVQPGTVVLCEPFEAHTITQHRRRAT